MVLFFLIGIAAFAFVMRTTEFLVVQDRINEIAGFYQSIGFVQVPGESFGNVLGAADVISQSRYVAFEDRRRGAEAMLHDTLNIYTMGRIGDGGHGHFLGGQESGYTEVPERLNYSIFYATVTSIVESNHPLTGHFVELRVTVNDVLVGYPEHGMVPYVPAEEAMIGSPLPGMLPGIGVRVRNHMVDGENPLLNMEVGGRYLMRASRYWVSPYGRGIAQGPGGGILYMRPLNENFHYIEVPHGNANLNMPGLEGLAEEIEMQRYIHSMVWLRTTADMSAMPMMQPDLRRMELVQGRLIAHEDYIESRPVAVIHHALSGRRGIDIGDTITVSIPREQEVVGLHTVMFFGPQPLEGWQFIRENFVFGDGLMDFSVIGNPNEFMIEYMELEVVGTFAKLPDAPDGQGPWSYTPTLFSNYIYIPNSLLPADFIATDSLRGYGDEYLWSSWYSFTLGDTRNENAFLLENRDLLAAMGYNVHFLPSGAAVFWSVAEPILTSLTFNAILFSIVLFIVFGLVTFLYMTQRRREFAIMRALGSPARVTVRKMLAPIVLLGMPAIIIGGTAGWFFALDAAAGLMETVAYATGYGASFEYPIYLMLLQLAIASVMMLTMVYIGGARVARLPVLELLQGTSQKRKRKKKAVVEAEVPTDFLQHRLGELLTSIKPIEQEILTRRNRFKANVTFVFRHIVRSPIKSALAIAVALFFIFAFGMLHEGMVSTEREINRLYETTVVSGEFAPANPWVLGGSNPTILTSTVNAALDTGFIDSYYAEAIFSSFFVIQADENGNFPSGVYGEFWDEFWQYIRDAYLGSVSNRVDPLFAFNDFDRFLEIFGERPAELMPGGFGAGDVDFGDFSVVTDPIDIQFAPGFSQYDFVYYDYTLQAPIPVILSDLTLQRRGLEVGDAAFIGHYFPSPWSISPVIEVPVIIIGQHNGAIDRAGGRNSVLLPFDALYFIREGNLNYINFQFEIDPVFNREMSHVRSELDALVNMRGQGGIMMLSALLHDDELIMVANQMEQNLELLRLLYPVTIVLSVFIGAGLASLLLLQSAKVAAIMRVLGYTKTRLRALLAAEHITVATTGVIVGLISLPIFGIGLVIDLPMLAGLYITGAVIGSMVGASMITSRAPLELLQVRE
ncbi:MAG: hypothetical protein FWC76_01170 [Defluviitaleaceae bacterium]|nr:hypothetical protein [Defluviitaleaceae bacterium]